MKKSIERQYAITFSVLVAVIIIACWGANVFLLSKVYITRKEQNMGRVYRLLDEASSLHGLKSADFIEKFESLSTRYNCDIIILDMDMNVIYSNLLDNVEASERLFKYFFGRNKSDHNVIYNSKNYTIQIDDDTKAGPQYIELWGIMSDGNPIGIRATVESINDSAFIANELLAIIGILAIIIGYFIVLFISKRITRPVQEMVNIADKMSKLDFDAKYEGHDDNEIGLLGNHINMLSTTLEKTISELKNANNELERELLARQELDEMRSDFISGASHELKTPIAVISGYAEGLKDCVNDDEDSRNYYCDVIMDEASKMNSIVTNLLNLNELEYGNDINIERFDIAELIRNCLERLDIIIKDNGINLVFERKRPVYVWSDALKIEQVINNYLSNAIHYVKGDEKIIKITIEKLSETVRVNVFNSGEPIDENAIPHLWDKFYKVDKARTREYGGSGVGLSIVKAVMESLKCGYGVKNYNNGVVFWFEADAKNV